MMKQAIPKIIHYCWFGGNEMPKKEQKCMKSWQKVLRDYTFMRWDETTFDVNSTEWTKTAYAQKKYAFVADYVRLYALFQYGGIYLDTDIEVYKSFSDLLNQRMFLGFEDVAGEVVSAGVIGAHKNDMILTELLEYYNQAFSMDVVENNEANVLMYTRKLLALGLIQNGQEQIIQGIHIYPRTYFYPVDFWGNWEKTKNTYCIHYFSASWLSEDMKKMYDKRGKLLFRAGKHIQGSLRRVAAAFHKNTD